MNIIFHELTLRNFLSYGNNVTKINLNFTDPTLIVGKNYDSIVDGQLDSNGAGKTAILNGIMYALYGKPLTNIALPQLVNFRNNKDMEVTITFQIGDMYYKVIRFRKNKVRGGDGVGVILLQRKGDMNFVERNPDDDEKEHDDITPDSIAHTNEKVKDILCMPFEICGRILVFSATYEPFLSLPVTHVSKPNQKDIIEELFNLTILTKKANTLKLQIKDDNKTLNSLEIFEEHRVKEESRYTEQLDLAKQRFDEWDDSNVSEIAKLKKNLKVLNERDIDFVTEESNINLKIALQEELKTVKDKTKHNSIEIETIKRDLKSAKDWDCDRLELLNSNKKDIKKLMDYDYDFNRQLFDALDKLNESKTSTGLKVKKLIREIGSIELKIGKLSEEKDVLKKSKCPRCKQTYSDAKKELKSVISILNESENSLDDSQSILDKKQSKSDKIESKIKKVESNLEFQSLRELENKYSELKNLKKNLKSLEVEKNPFTKNISFADMEKGIKKLEDKHQKLFSKDAKIDAKISKVKPQFTDLSVLYDAKNECNVIESKLAQLKSVTNPHTTTVEDLSKIKLDESKTEEINELVSTIEHKQFLLKLLTKKDSYIRKALLNKSIPLLNARLKCYLDKLGLPHRVEFSHEMTAKIRLFDCNVPFNNMSSGQKARINLALAFAFRDVLQDRHSRMNFCMLDECLDSGLGSVGVMMAARMLKEIAVEDKLAMFIVSHRDEISSMFDSKLVLVLKNLFTTVE